MYSCILSKLLSDEANEGILDSRIDNGSVSRPMMAREVNALAAVRGFLLPETAVKTKKVRNGETMLGKLA